MLSYLDEISICEYDIMDDIMNASLRLWSKSRYKYFEAFGGSIEERILQTDQLKNALKRLSSR